MPPHEEARWFAEHVQPHEQAVRAYLASRFPSLQDQDDVVQESFSRVLRAQTKGGGIRYVRAFFFSTAHNVAVDLFRRRARASGQGVAIVAHTMRDSAGPGLDFRPLGRNTPAFRLALVVHRDLPQRTAGWLRQACRDIFIPS